MGERLITLVPANVVAVAEGAIGRDDARMAATGFDAILVGELLEGR